MAPSKQRSAATSLTIDLASPQQVANALRIRGLRPRVKTILLQTLCFPETNPEYAYNVLRHARLYEDHPHPGGLKNMLGEKLFSTGKLKYLGQLLLSFGRDTEIYKRAVLVLAADVKTALSTLEWLKMRRILGTFPEDDVAKLTAVALSDERPAWAYRVLDLLGKAPLEAGFYPIVRLAALKRLSGRKSGAHYASHILNHAPEFFLALPAEEREVVVRAVAQDGFFSLYTLVNEKEPGKGLLTKEVEVLLPVAYQYALRSKHNRPRDAAELLLSPFAVFLTARQRAMLSKIAGHEPA